MKQTSLNHLQLTLTEIESKTVDSRSIYYFYNTLRDEKDHSISTPFIWDIGSFMAHSQERDKGPSHKKVFEFSTNILRFTEINDRSVPMKLFPLGELFTQDQLLTETLDVIIKLPLNFDAVKLIKNRNFLMLRVMENVSGTAFKIKGYEDYYCRLANEIVTDGEGNNCLYVEISRIPGVPFPRIDTPRMIFASGGGIRSLALKASKEID